MDIKIERFAQEIKNACGSNLESVILYGSKASGEESDTHSDTNILIILLESSQQNLDSMSASVKNWVKGGNLPPVIFTALEFTRSADVFPMEFGDMKENHKIIYGSDPFGALQIKDGNLRHECEFELRGKLLKLRQGYMLSKGDPAKLKKLLIESISTFLIIFKHVLRLLGVKHALKKSDVLVPVCEKLGLEKSVFEKVLGIRNGTVKAVPGDYAALAQLYLAEIIKATDGVDKLGSH